MRENHIQDFSVGYRVIDAKFIPAGESMEIKGRKYAGPVKVATRWKLKETSVCPIGADELAKTRADAEPIDEQNSAGKPATRKEIVMPNEQIEQIRKDEQNRIEEIRAVCKLANLEDSYASQWISEGTSADVTRKIAFEIMAARLPQGIGYRGPVDDYHPATITADATDKRTDAQIDGLLLRGGVISEKDTENKPAPGAREYAGFSLIDHARECLRAAGIRPTGSPDKIIRDALSQRALSTGDLPFILGGLSNKAAMLGFEEAQSDLVKAARKVPARDFKTKLFDEAQRI